MDVSALFKFSYGLYVVSVTDSTGATSACLINTAQQVTADPIQICITVNKENQTCQALLNEKHFALTVLNVGCDMLYIGNFGFKSSKDIDKYASYPTEKTCTGDVYTRIGASAVLSARVSKTLDIGTHIMFVATVEDAKVLSEICPLTYKYYHEVLKGKTPKRASSYIDLENIS